MLNQTPIAVSPVATRSCWSPWVVAAMFGFGLIGALLLFTEHRGQVLGILPFALALACPLMHVAMHRRHGREHASAPSHQEDHS